MIVSTVTSGTLYFIINPATSGYTGIVESLPPRRKPKKPKRKKKLPKYGRVVEP